MHACTHRAAELQERDELRHQVDELQGVDEDLAELQDRAGGRGILGNRCWVGASARGGEAGAFLVVARTLGQ